MIKTVLRLPGSRASLTPIFSLCLLISVVARLDAAEKQVIALPKPDRAGGKPLQLALQERKTTRDFKPDPLPPQVMSDLLWATFGMNREATGGRTAPSAMNSQEIDVYVATADGLFLYEAQPHQLRLVVPQDVRGLTSGQDFAKAAPVALIFVADLPRMVKAKPEQREFYAGMDTGYISQNVYLYCASANLGSVAHDLDRGPLAKAMNLRPDQRIMLAQAVGYPKAP
jgi:nitroreductase